MINYPLNKVDYYNNFNEFIKGMARKYGDRPAITTYNQKGEPITRSYSAMVSDAEAFGNALRVDGFCKKSVAIAAENSYEWLVAFLGATSVGCIAVLVDIEQSINTIRRMIENTDSVVVVASDSIRELLGNDYPLPIITMGNNGGAECGFSNYSAKGKNTERDLNGCGNIEISGEDIAAISFTSGTISTAKAVMLSQRGLLNNVAGSAAMIDPGDKLYTSLPLYHTYGLTCSALAALIIGTHVCLNGDMRTMLRDLKLFDPVTLMAVPLIAEMILKILTSTVEKEGIKVVPEKKRFGFLRKNNEEKILRNEDYVVIKERLIGGISIIVCGGAHLSAQVAKHYAQYGITVLQGYGITECSPLVSVNRNKSNIIGSVGQILPGLEVKFIDGEVFVRGESVMQGYYKDDDLTKAVLDDGWLCTGDLGSMDKYGNLYIEGRKKNLIVLKNGKKIAPEEIEANVMGIPIVGEVMAYGAASGDTADDVRLAIMVYPDPKITAGMSAYEILESLQAYIDRINAEYPAYKQIKLVNLRDKEFEKTSSKKIKRQIV